MDGRENWHKNMVIDDRENWHKNMVIDDRENWHKNMVMDGRESWHKKIVMGGRESSHKKIVMDIREQFSKFDAGSPWRQSKHWAHEHTDGLFGKLKRERAEPRDGLPGKIEKVVTDEKIEKVVTHEQKEVEKIVKSSRRVDGVLWKHRSFSRQFFV